MTHHFPPAPLLPLKRVWIVIALLLYSAPSAQAEDTSDASYTRVQDWLLLAAGAATGFVLHESGHLMFDLAVGDDPHLTGVKLGRFPFFAIEPRHIANSHELYSAAMMGFLVEAAYTEGIFARHPDLVHHHRPFLEGLLAFHVALDLGYAITGLANVGPPQSDVNSMARAAHLPRWATGTMLALPLVFDVLRYVKPETRRWSMWVGMASRLPMFTTVLVI